MLREPFDSNAIRSGGYDPASCPRAGAFHTQRIDRYRDGPPVEWTALADAASVGASFAAPVRTARESGHLVTRARATHHPDAPR